MVTSTVEFCSACWELNPGCRTHIPHKAAYTSIRNKYPCSAHQPQFPCSKHSRKTDCETSFKQNIFGKFNKRRVKPKNSLAKYSAEFSDFTAPQRPHRRLIPYRVPLKDSINGIVIWQLKWLKTFPKTNFLRKFKTGSKTRQIFLLTFSF